MKTYPSRLHSQNVDLNFSEQGKLLNCPEVWDAPSFCPDFKFAYNSFFDSYSFNFGGDRSDASLLDH